MLETASITSPVQQAVTDYEWISNAPVLAEALREQTVNVSAARAALRSLTEQVEERCSSWISGSMLRSDHRAKLLEHQETWMRAFSLARRSRLEEPILSMLRAVWKRVFLPVLLDRIDTTAGSYESEGRLWIRIFGSSQPTVSDDPVIVTDRAECIIAINSPRSGLSDGLPQQKPSLDLMIKIYDSFLRAEAIIRGEQGFDARPEKLTLYSCGPIGNNDLVININAIRNTIASLAYMEKLMMFCAESLSDKRRRNLGYVWDSLDMHGIPTPLFHKALSNIRHVERHAIAVARLRHRKQRADSAPATPKLDAKRSHSLEQRRGKPRPQQKRKPARREAAPT